MSVRQLPRQAVLGLVVAANVAVLALGWFVLVAPQRQAAASAADAVNATQAQIRQLEAPSASATATQPAIRTAALYRLAQAMPSAQDMPDLLLELDQVARAAGVTVVSIAPGPSTATPTGYSVVPVALTFTGDFYALTDLLYRLRALVGVHHGALDASGRLYSVANVALTPATGSKLLTAAVTVDAFVYAAPPAAAPAPAAATTGTTTTSTTGP